MPVCRALGTLPAPHPPATKARIIVSQRDALKTLFAASLAPGEVFQARVCGLTSYGVFLQVLDAGVRYVEVMLPRIEMERAGVDIERVRLVIGQGLLLRAPGQLSDQNVGGMGWHEAPGSSDASKSCTKLLSRSLEVFWDEEDMLVGKRLATFSLSPRRCSLKADGYRLLFENRRTGGGTLHACVAAFHMRMLATPGVESVTAREERRDWGQRDDGLQIWEAPRAERRGQASSAALRSETGLLAGAEAELGRSSSKTRRPKTSLTLALREGEVVREIAMKGRLKCMESGWELLWEYCGAESRVIQLVAGVLLDDNQSDKVDPSVRADLEKNIVDAISLLPKLQTGIDVNVRFKDTKGFEFTDEIAIFDLLNISLVHGWLYDQMDRQQAALIGDMSYNEAVMKIVTVLDGANGGFTPLGGGEGRAFAAALASEAERARGSAAEPRSGDAPVQKSARDLASLAPREAQALSQMLSQALSAQLGTTGSSLSLSLADQSERVSSSRSLTNSMTPTINRLLSDLVRTNFLPAELAAGA
ncbi:hypothetical protein H632_c720p0, partial [Helicosporidium sp. ATCC 50920]